MAAEINAQLEVGLYEFPKRLAMCKPWGSLGDCATLVWSFEAKPDRRIPARYTRIAIGLEHPEDIITDFTQALN